MDHEKRNGGSCGSWVTLCDPDAALLLMSNKIRNPLSCADYYRKEISDILLVSDGTSSGNLSRL